MLSDERPCCVCGLEWRPKRFDAVTCSDACRKRLERGGYLAYLRDWPADRAQARMFLHDALKASIDTQKSVTATRRERRLDKWRRQHVKPLHLKADPEPAPEEPPKHRGARYITV
jgi:hypothetical protein